MEAYPEIQNFLSCIEDSNNDLNVVKKCLHTTKEKILELKKHGQKADEYIIREFESLEDILSKGRLPIARGKVAQIKKTLSETKDQRKSDKDTVQTQRGSDGVNQPEPETKTPNDNQRQQLQPINSNDDYNLSQQSKEASRAMLQNNPDIADLSDVNRPTKIAERFSELYDNEWTEVFEALCKLKKGPLDERFIIKCLLQIVEDVYSFCYKEAQNQIEQLEKSIISILKGNMEPLPRKPVEGANLLVQYRKGKAELALDRLKKTFRDKLNTICRETLKLDQTPRDSGPTAKYADRAVELCWWMCVQDPPVHMCMSEPNKFVSSMYRAYTKSGRELDYFVWPALKLYENGGVLLKGVAQFK